MSRRREPPEVNSDRTVGRNKYAERWKRVREEVEEAEGVGEGERVKGRRTETNRGRAGETRVNVSSFQGEIQSEELRGAGRLDFWCIGVLIPALNYPLSWAQLGPLVKTPPLFVLRSR